MNIEQIIAEIEWLEHLLRLSDRRPLTIADRKVGSQKNNETSIDNPRSGLPRQEWLEDLFRLPDQRPLPMSDWNASQKHDKKHASDRWFPPWFLPSRRDGE